MHLAVYVGTKAGTFTVHVRPLWKVRAAEKEVKKSKGKSKIGHELQKISITEGMKDQEATSVLHWILRLAENHFATQGPKAQIGVFYSGLAPHESELITAMIRNAKAAAQLEEQESRAFKRTEKSPKGFRFIK